MKEQIIELLKLLKLLNNLNNDLDYIYQLYLNELPFLGSVVLEELKEFNSANIYNYKGLNE